MGQPKQTLNFITTKFKKGSIRCVSWISKQVGVRNFIKHALEMYIQREGASEKDINQEKSVLKETEENIAQMKREFEKGCDC